MKKKHAGFIDREIKSRQFLHLLERFTTWLETLGYKSKTVKLSGYNIAEFFSFLERQQVVCLKDYKDSHVNQYVEYLQHRPNCMHGGSLSASYLNKHVTTLRLFGKYLGQTGKANIIIKPGLFKTTETAKYLTKDEIQALYKAAKDDKNFYNQRDRNAQYVFYGCGLRASEGAALNIGDILFEKEPGLRAKRQNYRERYVPLNKQVKKDLKNYITGQRNELLNEGKQKLYCLAGVEQDGGHRHVWPPAAIKKSNQR